MKIRGRLAPYPLLAKTNDSYRKSSFDGIAELKAAGGELRLEFRAVLRCTSLRNLVRAGEEPRTRWQRVLVHLLEEEKLDLAAKDAQPLAVAQRLLRDPLNRAVQELEDLVQREEVGAWN